MDTEYVEESDVLTAIIKPEYVQRVIDARHDTSIDSWKLS